MFFFLFSQKTGFDISYKLSSVETICMKCQILFSGKNEKNIINLSSAELTNRVLQEVKLYNNLLKTSEAYNLSWKLII